VYHCSRESATIEWPSQRVRRIFIRHEGRWYVVVDWRTSAPAGKPMRLRPLNRRESQLVERWENFRAAA
jgi:hypothetical protein